MTIVHRASIIHSKVTSVAGAGAKYFLQTVTHIKTVCRFSKLVPADSDTLESNDHLNFMTISFWWSSRMYHKSLPPVSLLNMATRFLAMTNADMPLQKLTKFTVYGYEIHDWICQKVKHGAIRTDKIKTERLTIFENKRLLKIKVL